MMKNFFLTTLFFLATALSCVAQIDNPCENTDIDSVCPLDTWVIILAFAAFAFTTIHLYRRQKTNRA